MKLNENYTKRLFNSLFMEKVRNFIYDYLEHLQEQTLSEMKEDLEKYGLDEGLIGKSGSDFYDGNFWVLAEREHTLIDYGEETDYENEIEWMIDDYVSGADYMLDKYQQILLWTEKNQQMSKN